MADLAGAQRRYGLRFGVPVLTVVLFLAAFFPRVACPQQAAPSAAASVDSQMAATAALQAEYERRRLLNAASGNGGDSLDSASLVESAQTTPQGIWTPSFGVSSTKGTYKFPLTLVVHPVTPAGPNDGGLRWRFAQSEIGATYSPTQVKPKTPSTQLETAPTKMGTLSYKFPLKGTNQTKDYQEMRTAFVRDEHFSLASLQATDTSRSLVALTRALAASYLDQHDQRDTPPVLQIDLKLSYDWDHSTPTPNRTLPADYLTASLLASKLDIALGPGTTVIGFLSTLSGAWFKSLPNQAAYARDQVAVGGEIGRKGAFYFALQGTYDHYSGAGFSGLRGVTDAKLRSDVTFAEVVRFAVPGGHKIEVSVKELHANTADVNLMVIATATFKLSLRRQAS